ncbi:hypothetical protein SEA_LIGMA_78 [Gordonia phage Ligma]|nr:hypothetical protein SEA_LIGMA_78 [Gordonia phage Ligma]UQT02177.1 hypothetical protein SEA_AXUMITE_78 [Gordonia phage Axumite]
MTNDDTARAATLRSRAQGHRNEAERLIARAENIEAEAARVRGLRRFRPVCPLRSTDGSSAHSVVTFTRVLSGREYHYAATGWVDRRKAKTLWSITGEESGRFTWAQLLDFIEPENWRSIMTVARSSTPRVRDMRTPTPGAAVLPDWAAVDARLRSEQTVGIEDERPRSPFRSQEHRRAVAAAAESLVGNQAPYHYQVSDADEGGIISLHTGPY